MYLYLYLFAGKETGVVAGAIRNVTGHWKGSKVTSFAVDTDIYLSNVGYITFKIIGAPH